MLTISFETCFQKIAKIKFILKNVTNPFSYPCDIFKEPFLNLFNPIKRISASEQMNLISMLNSGH